MRKKLLNNIALKLIALVSAFCLWMIIVNVNDAYDTEVITLPVQEINAEDLESLNKTYEVVSGSTATATIRARRTVLIDVDSDDFTATADLSKMSITGAVPVEIKAREYVHGVEILPSGNVYQVATENLVEKQFPVIVRTSGQVASGYYLGEIKATPNIINIRSSETTVNNIKEVVVNIDVSNYSSNITREGLTPVLYNLNDEAMEMNRITMDVDKIDVTIAMLRTKTVPVNMTFTGEPAEGYMIVSQDMPETTVTVAGAKADLDKVSQIDMTYDLQGVRSTVEQTVLFRDFLPENIYLADGDLETAGVPISIVVEPVTSRNIAVNFDKILLLGQDEDMDYKLYTGDTVNVLVTGAKSVVDAVTPEDLTTSINVQSYSEGVYQAAMNVKLNGEIKNASVENMQEVSIQVSRKQK